jgi:hypothetical protein
MLEGLVGNELEQTDFTCTPQEQMSLCYTKGEDFLDFYGMSADHKVNSASIALITTHVW